MTKPDGRHAAIFSTDKNSINQFNITMKIYTKTGDKGQTSLIGGKRIGKDEARLEAYGTLDELNSCVGCLMSELPDGHEKAFLAQVQNVLFELGSTVALDPDDADAGKYGIKFPASHVAAIETEIDRITEQLPPLSSFVLPGGTRQAAMSHLCRTVCRRAERAIYRIKSPRNVPDEALSYVNRLSDYFFVLARSFNKIGGCEIIYSKS